VNWGGWESQTNVKELEPKSIGGKKRRRVTREKLVEKG